MSERWKKYAIKYGFSLVFAGSVAYAYISMRSFSGAARVDQYRMLCDAFSLPGMLLVLFGGLMWVAGKGTMDALGYIGKKLVASLIPGKRLDKEERYGDYVVRQREKRKGGYGFLFVSGGVCIAVSLVFLALYYSVK